MKKFAVVGHEIAYTLSPRLHELIAAATDRECTYDVFDVPEDRLEETVARLKAEYDGYNVTKPYKQTILKKDLLDIVSPVAVALGAVNTVHIDGDYAVGHNTDNAGFYKALVGNEMKPTTESRVLLLGAGGAARAAAVALSGAHEIVVANRTKEKAQALIDSLLIPNARAILPAEAEGGFDLIVNATTLGLNGENCLPAGVDLGATKNCFDMIYEPEETPFLAAAKEAGCRTANGKLMLIAQAIEAEQIWYKRKFTQEQLEEIVRAAMTML